MKKNIPLLLAVIVLIGAAFYGKTVNQMDAEVVQNYYKQVIPNAKFELISDRTARVYGQDGQMSGYIGVGSDVGYGGPVMVATVIDLTGKIKSVTIVDHSETLSYLEKINDKDYYKQYKAKTVSDSLLPMYDIQCISGATLSSRAIGNSVRETAHAIAETEFGIKPQRAQLKWQVGIPEAAVALLFIAGFVLSAKQKFVKYRLSVLFCSVVILGFWLNRTLSVAQISALFLGYFPAPETNLIWYLVLFGAIILALSTGKNIFCSYLCPFCGLQEFTHLLSKTNMPLGKYRKWIRRGRDIILFTVIFIAFITLNPSKASFEPFGTVFGLNGSKFGWNLAFVVLVISFVFKRFWCAGFCPAGAFLDHLARIGRDCRNAFGLGSKKSKGISRKTFSAAEKETAATVQAEKPASKNQYFVLSAYIVLTICDVLAIKSNLV